MKMIMTMNMKRNVMLIVAMCMVSAVAFAQKTIRVSTDKTDLVLKVSPKGRLYQVYLGDKLRPTTTTCPGRSMPPPMLQSVRVAMRLMQPRGARTSSSPLWP